VGDDKKGAAGETMGGEGTSGEGGPFVEGGVVYISHRESVDRVWGRTMFIYGFYRSRSLDVNVPSARSVIPKDLPSVNRG
jgi:hypothetical protein